MSDPDPRKLQWRPLDKPLTWSNLCDFENLPLLINPKATIDLSLGATSGDDPVFSAPSLGMTLVLDEVLKGFFQPEPITVAKLIADAKEIGYTEVYGVFRYRNHAAPGRHPEVMAIVPTLDAAVKKLLFIAGFDTQADVELLGLDQFDASNIMELCDRLTELTGDDHIVCPYEMPIEN
ncbi:hypothetical protein ABID82_007144 [Methylobacterium sp. PvP062]|uniref:Uncharacterized protein n=1 Tax=Methylobacterium radiotolerans TaxID=31998 RepID=A0ABV2NU38_9HYPH|nr:MULTISPECIES: hypothetical protein [unclassified Methylobacterium]MBP2498333.1 hypothetical protein [Methylobacterium sp. PvP105]MBP2505717.1 hypothetical protein [Methylobacterium sp. PvP109]